MFDPHRDIIVNSFHHAAKTVFLRQNFKDCQGRGCEDLFIGLGLVNTNVGYPEPRGSNSDSLLRDSEQTLPHKKDQKFRLYFAAILLARVALDQVTVYVIDIGLIHRMKVFVN